MGTMDVPLITLVLVALLLSVFTTSTIAIRLEEKGKKNVNFSLDYSSTSNVIIIGRL